MILYEYALTVDVSGVGEVSVTGSGSMSVPMTEAVIRRQAVDAMRVQYGVSVRLVSWRYTVLGGAR